MGRMKGRGCLVAALLMGFASILVGPGAEATTLASVGARPLSLTFDQQPVGQTTNPKTITVVDGGPGPVQLPQASITGAQASDFALSADSCSGQTIQDGQSCTLDVSFTPATAGVAMADVIIITGYVYVHLTGTTPDAPVVTLAPPALSFAPQPVGQSATQSLIVNNTGNAPLLIGTVSLSGAQAAQFATSADTCSNRTVYPTESCSVAVTFTPTAGGAAAASLSIADNAAGSPQTVALSGTATGAAPTPGPSNPGATPAAVTRLAGANRIATAIAVSRQAFGANGSAQSVVLARDDQYPDALAGVPLATAKAGPLLLTETASLDPATQAEIRRVLPTGGLVYLLGGSGALDPSIDAALRALGYQPQRLAGSSRFSTAVRVAQALGDPSNVFEVTGTNFPDALAAGPAAISSHGAILLTNGAIQSEDTFVYLRAHPSDHRSAVGGPAVIADTGAAPVAGTDRFATSAAVATTFFPTPKAIGLATGLGFSDALAGGVVVGPAPGPILLVTPSTPLPATVAAYLSGPAKGLSPGPIYVLGGTAAVGDDVAAAAQAQMKGT